MPSLTIKGLDERVLERLRAQARTRQQSLSGYVRHLLAEAAGVSDGVRVHDDLAELAGSWTEADAREFEENTRPFEEIDDDLWR